MSKRLESEVWSLDNCSGCGLCVAVCSKQVLGWNSYEHPVRDSAMKNIGYTKIPMDSCSFCDELCAEVCPRLSQWEPIEARVAVKAKARKPIQSGAPNDVIRSVLAAAYVTGQLDGVLLLDVEPWTLKPIAHVVDGLEEIASNIGPQYLWAPLLDALNEAIFVRGMQSLAVVGTPCTAQAIRQLKESDNPRLRFYQEAIRLTISTFCTGIYRPELIDDLFVRQLGIATEHIRRVDTTADGRWLEATLWDGSVKRISRQEAEPYSRAGCASCTDFSGESADLAIGQLTTSDDASLLTIRSRDGDVFVRNAILMNMLETGKKIDQGSLEQISSEKVKRDRAQTFKETQVLMMDALVDPVKRNEAIRQFTNLYRSQIRTKKDRVNLDGCNGC